MHTQVVVRGQELKIDEGQTRNLANMSEASYTEPGTNWFLGGWTDCCSLSACKPEEPKVDTARASEFGAFPPGRCDRDVLIGNAGFGNRGTRPEWERP
jgi:hypothetical protein